MDDMGEVFTTKGSNKDLNAADNFRPIIVMLIIDVEVYQWNNCRTCAYMCT